MHPLWIESAEDDQGTSGRQRPPASVWLAVGSTLVGLALAFLLKAPCGERLVSPGSPYPRFCYSDIQPFAQRGLAPGLPYVDYRLEYPVLTGSFIKGAGLVLESLEGLGVEPTVSNYVRVSAVLLAPFAMVVTLLLRPRVTRSRLLLWSLGSPLVFHAFLNWDLLAVAGAVWGLVELERQRFGPAGAALALGASAKLFPAFVLPAAILERWSRRDRAGGTRLVAGFALVALLVNLPWILAAPRGWFAIWQFHAARDPDLGTVWSWIGRHGAALIPGPWWATGAYRDLVSRLSLVLFAAGTGWFLWRGWTRRTEPQGYPVAAVSLGIIAVFLLVSKVHSPQYALWVVPFLVLLDVPWWLVLAYLLGDALVFLTGFVWASAFDRPFPLQLFEGAVFVRAGALGGLAWWASRAHRVWPVPDRGMET